ncbi:hypothetical protein [Absidia glauca]|uniref:J domain-containing protein n=1 Tax=Absidia glauca TaxID=4829 RepID=A0A168MWJ7_ABSGL|nr:hypothetical protein [Absidia glauca]
MPSSNSTPVDTYYYDVLNIPTNANHIVIKKAYKKLAISYHPDKNKAPDAEEKFKTISEAFQILGTHALRVKYDKYGRDPDIVSLTGVSDPNGCYQCMFGEIVGDMQIGHFFQQDDRYYAKGQAPPTHTDEERQQLIMQHMEQLQQERIHLLASRLVDKLSLYTTKLSTFEHDTQNQIIDFKKESFGNSMLVVVGRVYATKAKEFLGIKRAGGLPGLYYTMREKKYITKELWRTVKATMESQAVTKKAIEAQEEDPELDDLYMIKCHQAIWQMAKFEVEATLRLVCDDVLQDKSVLLNERLGRAEGLLALGDLYVANADISDVENEVVQLK